MSLTYHLRIFQVFAFCFSHLLYISPCFAEKIEIFETLQSEYAETLGIPQHFDTLHEISLVLIPPSDESQQPGFYISRNEITASQFAAVLKSEKAPLNREPEPQGNLPATHLNLQDSIDFANALSESSGLTCRVPFEKEWKQACILGNTTEVTLNARAWHSENGPLAVQPVGTKEPDEAGLHDMLGNTWEWTLQQKGELIDGGSVYSGSAYLRGGAFNTPAKRAACEAKQRLEKEFAYASFVGFRIVCNIPEADYFKKKTSRDRIR
jgi:formylglycine-generating enzyme required for sulfatase activity